MALQELVTALVGNYEASGLYSFEFAPVGKKRTLAEIFLLLPPESVTVSEPQRASLIPTLTGGYYSDHGAEFKDITIEGSVHFYYAGSPSRAGKQYGITAKDIPNDVIDGFTEFMKLRFMLSRYRDYTMSPNGKLKTPNFSSIEGLTALRDFVMEQIDKGRGALADQLELIWHDYDYDDHYKVKIENFTAVRSKDDPWTVKYTINMLGYEVDTSQAAISFNKPVVFFKFFVYL
jgi:hypothetical protein